MAPRKRAARPAPPVSVAVSGEHRRRLEAEARRRGLGFSPTIRTLALERLTQLEDQRQLARARRWQLERALEVAEEIGRGTARSVSWDEVEAAFDEALEQLRRRTEATSR